MSLKKPIAGPHLVRYGTPGDQKYLLKPFLKTYDQIVLNASIVAHMPGALASFLAQRARNKPYFIDPQTHAFQHDIEYLESTGKKSKGDIKRSIRLLLEAYGEPLITTVGKDREPVLPGQFSKARARRAFCERVIRFQLGSITAHAKKSDTAKYYKFLKKKGRLKAIESSPSLVVAPYFCMTAGTLDSWLPVNVKCAKDSKALGEGDHLAVQIVITQDVLSDSDLCAKVIRRYKQTDPDVILLWIDQFSEDNVSESLLAAYVALVRELGRIAPVVNLYGGYFSVAMVVCGVGGAPIAVAHGLEYGEQRGVVPVGGGLPTAKFYYPSLHTRLSFRDALRAVRAVRGMKSAAAFHKKVCNCQECKTVIKQTPEKDFAEFGKSRPIWIPRGSSGFFRDFPLPETKDHTVRHYMWNKSREYGAKANVAELRKKLERATELKKVLGLRNVTHCDAWASVLGALSRGK